MLQDEAFCASPSLDRLMWCRGGRVLRRRRGSRDSEALVILRLSCRVWSSGSTSPVLGWFATPCLDLHSVHVKQVMSPHSCCLNITKALRDHCSLVAWDRSSSCHRAALKLLCPPLRQLWSVFIMVKWKWELPENEMVSSSLKHTCVLSS